MSENKIVLILEPCSACIDDSSLYDYLKSNNFTFRPCLNEGYLMTNATNDTRGCVADSTYTFIKPIEDEKYEYISCEIDEDTWKKYGLSYNDPDDNIEYKFIAPEKFDIVERKQEA